MSRPTAVELAAEQDRAKARRYFMGWLVASTAVSVGGNVAHAVLDYLPVIVVKVAVATVPPIVALVTVHGVAVLARCGRVTRADSNAKDAGVYAFAVTVTGLLTTGAAVLSFTGLYDVAVAGGLGARLAPLWPLCVDAGIAVSTVALVVLRPASAADLRAVQATTAPARSGPGRPVSAPAPPARTVPTPSGRTADTPPARTAPAPTAPRSRTAHAPALRTVPAAGADSDAGAVARAVVDAGATTKSVNHVEQVLAEHAAGTAVTRIATATGMHHKTVRTITAGASHQLATVG
jgi:hypothetical protein